MRSREFPSFYEDDFMEQIDLKDSEHTKSVLVIFIEWEDKVWNQPSRRALNWRRG